MRASFFATFWAMPKSRILCNRWYTTNWLWSLFKIFN